MFDVCYIDDVKRWSKYVIINSFETSLLRNNNTIPKLELNIWRRKSIYSKETLTKSSKYKTYMTTHRVHNCKSSDAVLCRKFCLTHANSRSQQKRELKRNLPSWYNLLQGITILTETFLFFTIDVHNTFLLCFWKISYFVWNYFEIEK